MEKVEKRKKLAKKKNRNKMELCDAYKRLKQRQTDIIDI